jgi:hypothetical protein
MNPRVKEVTPNKDYTLTLVFTNGEVKVFDMRPYLGVGIFKELQDWNKFKSVKPFLGSIQWLNKQDLCPDTLYDQGKSLADLTVTQTFPKRYDAHTIRTQF